MSEIQVKCYLLPSNLVLSGDKLGQANEIRRFALDIISINLYESLIGKIQKSFGALLPDKNEIKTYWLDEENDLVCFSTHSEIGYAIDLQTAIQISKPYEHKANSFLFKVYIQRKLMNEPVKENLNNNKQEQLHPGVVCDGCQGAVYGDRFKCTQCPDYDLCSNCKQKSIHSEHDFIKFDKPVTRRCPYNGRNRGMFGGWGRHGCHSQSQSTQQQQQQKQQNSNQTNSNPIQEALNNFLPFLTSNFPIVNDPVQLKNLGEHLKQYLDPFGIDLEYHIDGPNGCQFKKEETEKKSEKDQPKTNEESKNEQKEEEKKETVEKINIESEIQIEPIDSSINMIPLIRSESLSSLNKTPSAPAKDDLVFINNDSSPFEKAANALKKVIEKEKENKNEDNLENNFNMVDVEKEVKMIECIESLKLMGYSDDGGWLTRLVVAKNGNINNVLDALQPSK